MTEHYKKILQCPLFHGIHEVDLPHLLPCLKAFTKTYEKNEIIFLAGTTIHYTCVVLQGSVQIVYEDILGNRTIFGNVGTGELFGETFSFFQQEPLPVSVISNEESLILYLDCGGILTTCSSTCKFHHQLIENMLKIFARKNIFLNKKIRYLSKRTTREKLLAYLSDEATSSKETIFSIPFSRQELADFLCVERSAMSTELNKIKKDGILDFHKNQFRFKNS